MSRRCPSHPRKSTVHPQTPHTLTTRLQTPDSILSSLPQQTKPRKKRVVYITSPTISPLAARTPSKSSTPNANTKPDLDKRMHWLRTSVDSRWSMWKSHVDPVHLLSPSPSPCGRLFCCGTRVSTPPEDREQTQERTGEDRARHGQRQGKTDETGRGRRLSLCWFARSAL
jgi:hypothetical protein